MKLLKMLVIATLLTQVGAMAMTAKIKDDNKKIYEVLKGDTRSSYMKPGLAVDLIYSSEHVEVGEFSDINISIITDLNEGILKVNLKSLEDELIHIEEKNLEFKLSKSENIFPINLQVSSEEEGEHYLTVFISLEGHGGRVFDIPVKIGTISEKISTKPVEITDEGVAVSSSPAEEEIK
ncbi:MAG: Unknown protein [uncultured Sulfurovum sp.]|uniref:Uncharacterized protein n=1 Tax=uncultured Sulfurovum sp. TaxID=269237 RepID=A0A6S6TVB3_9BACT|nr:MAG: Unknown protein [uncultured Sulfurovum sp.]